MSSSDYFKDFPCTDLKSLCPGTCRYLSECVLQGHINHTFDMFGMPWSLWFFFFLLMAVLWLMNLSSSAINLALRSEHGFLVAWHAMPSRAGSWCPLFLVPGWPQYFRIPRTMSYWTCCSQTLQSTMSNWFWGPKIRGPGSIKGIHMNKLIHTYIMC